MVIGLISSVPEEGGLLLKQLRNRKSTAMGKLRRISASPHLPVISGSISGKDIVYVISGIGKVNAAHAATLLLERFSPDLVILFGVGGAYPSAGLNVGDIAIAERETYGDEGVLLKDGFHGTELIGIPLLEKGRKKYFNEFRLDRGLVRKVVSVLTRGKGGVTVKSGTFVTFSTCTGTRKRAMELKKRFDAVCENMEGAAVAHVCAAYGTPMIEMRGISNIVEDRDRRKWDIPLAAENCRKALAELLATL